MPFFRLHVKESRWAGIAALKLRIPRGEKANYEDLAGIVQQLKELSIFGCEAAFRHLRNELKALLEREVEANAICRTLNGPGRAYLTPKEEDRLLARLSELRPYE